MSTSNQQKDLQTSAILGLDGHHLTVDLNKELNSFFRKGVNCRWCSKEVHADSYQVVMFNDGVLVTPSFSSADGPATMTLAADLPHIYCGCGEACMARDMARGVQHLREMGVIE